MLTDIAEYDKGSYSWFIWYSKSQLYDIITNHNEAENMKRKAGRFEPEFPVWAPRLNMSTTPMVWHKTLSLQKYLFNNTNLKPAS